MNRLVTLLVTWATVFEPSFEDPVDDFAAGNNKFSADLYNGLSNGKSGNLIICPLSAETVLSMVAEGAKGVTASELFNGVDLPNNTNDRHEAFESILPGLRGSSANFQLSIASRIYISQRYSIKNSYKDTVERVYQSDIESINFNNRQQAANTINKWVEGETNNKIKDIVNPDSLSPSTAMVLVNTLYLKAKWETPFDPRRTRREPFFGWDGSRRVVETLHSKDGAKYKYFHCGFYNAKFLEIPFKDSDISMTFILPDDADSYSNMKKDIGPYLTPHNVKSQQVYVAIPKFSITSTNQLDEVLKKLGIERAYDPTKADFSGIANGPNLHIDSVNQKVFINVTENGIEAAGATTVSVSPTVAERPPPVSFIADHPFAFYIKDEVGVIIFLGGYNGP